MTEDSAMRIAIIGAGNVGTSLTTAFRGAGHDVVVASRDPEDAARVATANGAQAADSNAEAAAAADVVVLAIPFASFGEVAAEIAPVVTGKPVIDVSNRMSFGAAGPEIDTTTSNAEELATLLPQARVVKAFNTLFASNQASPVLDGIRLDGFVAADDEHARATVLELVSSVGLDPIDVGPLVRARQLEGLAFMNIYLNVVREGSWQSGWKLVGAPTTTPAAA
jgi:NADPH-dependent F420 reductase